MSNAYLNAIEAEILETYAGYSRAVQVQSVVVEVWRDLLAQATALVDYDEGEASEKLSQQFKNMQAMREAAIIERNGLIAETRSNTIPPWVALKSNRSYKDRPSD